MRSMFGLVLVAGLGLAGTAVWMVRGQFAEQSQVLARQQQAIAQAVPTVEVWAAKRQLVYGETITAEEAYEDVLDDVGANVPMLDDHDKRIIQEVRDGTYKYKGSKTGLPGHIDNEADAGGLETFPTVERPSDWDTDDDGMPDDWETAHGLNPDDAEDRNGTNLSKIGYTNLEMYLNELAGDLDKPHAATSKR